MSPRTVPTDAELEEISNRPFNPDRPMNPSGGEVVRERRPKVTFSARVDAELSPALIAEATRCRQNPSQLIADLIAEALQARQEKSHPVLIDVAELHRAIDAVVRKAA